MTLAQPFLKDIAVAEVNTDVISTTVRNHGKLNAWRNMAST